MKIIYSMKPLYCFIISAILFLSANVALGQTLTSDAADYPPGATAILTGSGFQPGENVEMVVEHADAIPDTGAGHGTWMVVANLLGSFVTTWHVCEDDCEGSFLKASADGQSSGLHAEAFFTDAACNPPTITSQPIGGTRYVGESMTFKVKIIPNGTGIVTFQWRKNGVNIPGAVTVGGDSSVYTISQVSTNDAGSYSVVINRAGCATIATSTLVVLTVGNISGGTIASDQAICSGETPATLTSTIDGSGDGTITYQWEESNDNSTWIEISGATGLTYSPGALTQTSYYRRVTIGTFNGHVGTSLSNVVTITVNPKPVAIASSNSPLCAGSTLILSAGGGGTYSWTGPDGFTSTLQNPIITNITNSANGTYTVTVTNEFGCSDSSSASVIVNPTYTITLAPVAACVSFMLPWGENVTATGDYNHTDTSVNGCDSTVAIHVTINQSYDTAGDSVTACGSYTFPWGQIVSVSGDYSHTDTSVNGCDSVVTVNVLIEPLPIVTASNNGPLCTGDTLNLSATGGSALPGLTPDFGTVADFILFTSTGAVSNTAVSVITGNIGTNVGAITGFEISIVNGSFHNGDPVTAQCVTDLTAAYNVLHNTAATNTSHAPAFGSGETVFAGVYSIGGAGSVAGNLTLDAQGDPNAIFIFKTGGAFTTGAGTTVNLINGASACNVFWVAEGAIAMAAVTTMKGTLIANNGAISMGAGGSLEGRMYSTTGAASFYTVTASLPVCASPSAASYAWTGPNGFTSSLQNPSISNVTVAASGIYTVTVTNSAGCSATDTTSVTVNDLSVTITGNDSICSGATSILDAGAGFTSYLWSTGATTQTISVNTAGTYTVTVTNSSGCTGSASLTVTANANPSPTITGNNVGCSEAASTLDAGAGYAGYIWSTGATTQTISVSTAGTYTVTVTNSSGCTGSASLTVTVNANPAPVITGNNVICSVECGGTASTFDAGAGYASYLWSTGATTQTISVSTAGTYTVTVTNSAGCTGTASRTLTVSDSPDPTITGNNTICSGTATTIDAGAGYASYIWSTGATTQTISVSTAGTYTVTVTNAAGCTGSATICVTAHASPTATACSNSPVDCGNTLYLTSSGGTSYSWTGPNGFVSTLQNPIICNVSDSEAGTYSVLVTNSYGCTDIATTTVVVTDCSCKLANNSSITDANNLKLYPNPSNGVFVIELDLDEAVSNTVDIQVLNLFGQIIFVNRTDVIDGILRQEVKFDNNLQNGNYQVQVISGERVFTGQVIYQK